MKIRLTIYALLLTMAGASAQPDPHELIRLAIANARAVQSAAFKIENTERFDGELRTGTQEVRYRQQPFQVWMTFVYPDPGATILYDATANRDKMIYDPVGFPYMKLELDPLGTVARNNNQHTIYEIGFEHIAKLIETVYEGAEAVTLLPKSSDHVQQVRIISGRKGFRNYTVGKGESTRSIAQLLRISEYKLVEMNEDVRAYGELKEGMQLLVPEYYALSTIVSIDATSRLPVKLSLTDEVGLLADYTLTDVRLGVDVLQPEIKKKAKAMAGQD